MPTKPFNGVIKIDIRDATPDWKPYIPKQAPKDSPNVLIVLYDDTGLAVWSPYGGAINMPTAQKLADNGIVYSQDWFPLQMSACVWSSRSNCVNRDLSLSVKSFSNLLENQEVLRFSSDDCHGQRSAGPIGNRSKSKQ